MNGKLLAICVLTITAVGLMFANFYNGTTARADESINSRDYQMVTARAQNGGDNVYVMDNRLGILQVFVYDAQSRALRARAVRPASDVFK